MPLSKKRKLPGKNGHPKPHTANPNDSNHTSIIQKFWKGDELSATEKEVMGATIARESQLATHPTAELIDLLGKYRRNFGPKANPFNTVRWLDFLENSGQFKEPEKGEDKLDTELEITLSAVMTPSFPAQELFLSPTLRIRTSMLNMFREGQVQRERVHQLKDTLEKYRCLIGWLVKALRKEQTIGLGLLHEMTGRPEVTIQEHRHPQSVLTLRDNIKKNGEQGLRELCYESQWSLCAPLEKLRITASSIPNRLYDVPALPIHEEIPCLDNIQDLQLSYCECVDDIVKFDRNTNVQKDVFSLVKDTAELADRYRKEQAVISPNIAQDCTLKMREEKQRFIETKLKNVLLEVPIDNNRLEETIKEARAIARSTEAQRVLRILDEFIKAASSFDRIHLDQQVKEEPT